jgi:putative ABC transport system ATP-binding protein
MSYIQAYNLKKEYGTDDAVVHAVNGMSFTIEPGEFVSIMGESGSGKSTLLSMLGAMNRPTSGELLIDDIDIYNIDGERQADFRREFLGFIFQSFHLMPYLTVIENVMLPLVITGFDKKEKIEMAHTALGHVGLLKKADRLPNQISGGEMERVAIARAIVNEPPILLADEPTGNLDTETSAEIMDLLLKFNSEGMTVIMVTHNPQCAECAHRIMRISDGVIISDNSILKIIGSI